MTTGKPKFKKGDIVRLVGNSQVGRGMHGRIVDIELDYPDWGYTVDGRSGLFFADEEDLELVSERFTEEENSMKNKMNEKGGDSDWVSLDNIIGMRVGENVDDGGEGFWKAMDDVDNLEKKGYWSGKFKVGDKVNWIDPEYDEITSGWTVVSAPDEEDAEELPPEEAMYTIVNDDGSEAEVLGSELRPIEMTNEETLENELKKGDDGWTTIGQPVTEANVVVDANTVWDVLDLLDDTDANNNLTDLINSHLRTEDEIMDAIDSYVETNWHGKVKKQELNKLFTDWMYVIVDDLGLDVDKYRENGEFVDEGKPTSVELEDTIEQKPEEVKNQDKTFNQDGENKTLVAGEDKKKPVLEMTIEQEVDDPWKLSEMLWGQGKENLEDLLRANVVGDEDLMQMLEDMELRNLTSINDAFAFDFPSILDSLGLDGEAWSQNLEIKRKGDGSED